MHSLTARVPSHCVNLFSPVHVAATVGSIEGLELLSSYNGDINAQSTQYITPLHDAAVNGQTGKYQVLQ